MKDYSIRNGTVVVVFHRRIFFFVISCAHWHWKSKAGALCVYENEKRTPPDHKKVEKYCELNTYWANKFLYYNICIGIWQKKKCRILFFSFNIYFRLVFILSIALKTPSIDSRNKTRKHFAIYYITCAHCNMNPK